jgi:hypothetical protein
MEIRRSCRYREPGFDLIRSEAGSGERSTSGGFRAGQQPWAAAAVLPVLRRKMPPEGLAWASHRDVVRQSGGAASPVSVPCLIAPRRASIGTLPKCGRRGSRDGRNSPGLPEHALNPTPAPVPSPLGIPKLKAGERLPLTAVAESDHRWG